MKNLVCLFALSLLTALSFSQSTAPDSPKNTAFTNGGWFDGHSFRWRNAYAVDGVLSFRRPAHISAVVDLGGGFAIPPFPRFGEAHNHNVEPLNKRDRLAQRYLQHGIFYVKDPDNLPMGRDQFFPKSSGRKYRRCFSRMADLQAKVAIRRRSVKRNIDRGVGTEAEGDGAFYNTVSDVIAVMPHK